ncbi:MAG TPA: nucleotidyltransferase family protein [Chloroflexota bacterium]|jgi:molybdenum cofactor cytidylyltransferase|nr:nucleotidyltransferase family protein [Chloroflexota bacterium]
MNAEEAAEPPIYGIVLASGSSTRFGDGNKLLATVDGASVLFRTVAAYCAATRETLVVLQEGDEAVAAELASSTVRIIWNGEYRQGQSAALRLGVAALPDDAAAAVIGVADQPLLLASTIEALTTSWLRERIATVVPVYKGCPGNPVLFSRGLFPDLLAVTGDLGGREVMRRHPSRHVVIEEWWTALDVDTEEDLSVARQCVLTPPRA